MGSQVAVAVATVAVETADQVKQVDTFIPGYLI